MMKKNCLTTLVIFIILLPASSHAQKYRALKDSLLLTCTDIKQYVSVKGEGQLETTDYDSLLKMLGRTELVILNSRVARKGNLLESIGRLEIAIGASRDKAVQEQIAVQKIEKALGMDTTRFKCYYELYDSLIFYTVRIDNIAAKIDSMISQTENTLSRRRYQKLVSMSSEFYQAQISFDHNFDKYKDYQTNLIGEVRNDIELIKVELANILEEAGQPFEQKITQAIHDEIRHVGLY